MNTPSTVTTSAQEIACDALFALDFECVGNFAADSYDPESDARCIMFSLRVNSFSSLQAQVDPDGTVNGLELAAYLKANRLA